ncbi:MAG TPA: O-antigen ligase family protein, partial [Limnobacter sp.]|nr:O-antigen ligase family protein [Limnobacter sp.]
NTLFYTLLPTLVLSIAMTQTRSAWAALLLMGIIYGIAVSRVTLVWLLIGLVIAAFIPAVQDRVLDLMQGNEVIQYAKLNSFAWRQYIWESGLNWMSPARYLFGYGIGGFFYHSVDFFPLSGGMPFGAHNVFVERFFDGGIVAVSVFAVFFAVQLRWACKLLGTVRAGGLAYLGLVLTYLTLNASDNVVDYLAYNWYYWAVAGALYAQARRLAGPTPSNE